MPFDHTPKNSEFDDIAGEEHDESYAPFSASRDCHFILRIYQRFLCPNTLALHGG
jgi:hypothetical protein